MIVRGIRRVSPFTGAKKSTSLREEGPPHVERTARYIADLLRSRTYAFTNEVELQESLAQRIADDGLVPLREVRLTDADRVDLMVDVDAGALAIEVKIAGTNGDVRRQLTRYAASDRVAELMLVTTVRRHLSQLGPQIGGKPLTLVLLRGGM